MCKIIKPYITRFLIVLRDDVQYRDNPELIKIFYDEYKHVTVDNMIKSVELNDYCEIIERIITLCPDFDITQDDHRLFKTLRNSIFIYIKPIRRTLINGNEFVLIMESQINSVFSFDMRFLCNL